MSERLLRVLARSPLASRRAAAALVGARRLRLVGSIDAGGVATFEVEPGRFVREVEARGLAEGGEGHADPGPAGVGAPAEGRVPRARTARS